MDVQVKTRWTADGLVEITIDAATAQQLRELVYDARRKSDRFDRLADSLAHTLDVPKKEETP